MYRCCSGLLLLALAGCASNGGGEGVDPHTECRVELKQVRGNLQTEVAELRNGLQIIRDEFDLLERKRIRQDRELTAARETAASHELAFNTAMGLVRERDEELSRLRRDLEAAAVPTPPEGELAGAMELLRQKDQAIRDLREELAFVKAGGRREIPVEVQGGVRILDLDLDKPVALVDERPISRRGFVQFLYRDLATPHLLGLFINRHLILTEGKRRGLEVSDLDAEVWVENQIVDQVQSAGSEESFLERLAESGYTKPSWLSRLRYQARPAILLSRLVAQERTTPDGKAAWETRLREAYGETYGEVVSGDHILFRVAPDASEADLRLAMRKADSVGRELEGGLAFAEAARRFSEDGETSRMGGYLGEFSRDRFADLPNLNTAFFTAEVGKPTRPIRSRVGFHIVLVEDRKPPPLSFDEARPKLELRLRDEQPSDGEMEALIKRLRQRVTIKRTLEFTDDDE